MQPLPPKFRAILDTGQHGYSTQFSARRALVLAAINAGWAVSECELAFLDASSPVRDFWVSSRGVETPERRLAKDYRQAGAKAAESPAWQSPNDVRQWLGERIALVSSSRFPGRTGRTDKAVYLAALRIASDAGTSQPNLPVRKVALMSGVTRRTVPVALRRLSNAGHVSALRYAEHGRKYSLSISPYGSVGKGVQAIWGKQETAHETWVRLGKAALDVWASLTEHPQSAADIIAATGAARSTVFRQLPKLASYNLAARDSGGWIAGKATPDDVVIAEGWMHEHSKTEKRRAEYEEDREIFNSVFRQSASDAWGRSAVLSGKRTGPDAEPWLPMPEAPAEVSDRWDDIPYSDDFVAPVIPITDAPSLRKLTGCARHADKIFGWHSNCQHCLAVIGAAA